MSQDKPETPPARFIEFTPQQIEAWRLEREIARLVDNGWGDKDFDFREHGETN